MKITIHRGAQGIGGTCIELQSSKSRILLDYGAPLTPGATPEQSALAIPGLYEASPVPISGLFISHTHRDHYGALFARPVNPGVKVYMTEIMEDVIRINAKLAAEPSPLKADIRYFRNGKRFIVGNFVITPYLMDHTAAESFAFLAQAEGHSVLYTGDWRGHGCRVNAFRQFLAADMGKIDVLITEGTQADVNKGPAEQDVMDQVQALVKGGCGALFAVCTAQNIDLLASLAAIARATRRYLVVDGHTALLLQRFKSLALQQGLELKIPSLDTEYLRIVDNAATRQVSALSEYAETFSRMRTKMFGWDWLRQNQDQLIIALQKDSQAWVGEQLKDLRRAVLIYPRRVEGQDDGLQATLDYFKATPVEEIEVQTSGHAYFADIRKLVENKKPRHIIPVHTGHPEVFTKTFGRKVHTLKDGESFVID